MEEGSVEEVREVERVWREEWDIVIVGGGGGGGERGGGGGEAGGEGEREVVRSGERVKMCGSQCNTSTTSRGPRCFLESG